MDEVIERMKSVLKERGDTKNAFAISVGINPSNFNRKMRGEIPFTQKDYAKISQATGINRSWLETGKDDLGSDHKQPQMTIKSPSHQIGFDSKVVTDAIEKAISEAINNPSSAFSVVANVLGNHNNQNVMSGTDRAKEREEESLKEKNTQLIQIINAQNETIRSKDSEIRLLRKILADNGIGV